MTAEQFPERISQDLRGKVAIVTGAGSRAEGIGNGRAAAILLSHDRPRFAVNASRLRIAPGSLCAKKRWLAAAEAARNSEADEIRHARHSQLCPEKAALIRHGLVADADRLRDVRQAAALGEKSQNLDVAGAQLA